MEGGLIDFSVEIIEYSDPKAASFTFQHLSQQLIISATSAALNYGESRSAESTKDFIHKLHVSLKELRECMVNLKIGLRAKLKKDQSRLDELINECNQLIAILVSTINTTRRNNPGG